MSDLVGNLLELSRLQSGGVQLRWEWNSVEELFASAIRHRKAVLEGREIVFDVPENLGLVWCDGLLVERVVVNLLDNAARHTPAGTPLRLWADEMSKFVQIGLDDEVSGFALDTVPRDGGRGGIGLSLCRAIAKTHGGRLAVDSRPAGGSRVFLELPRNPMEPEVPTELD